MPHRPNTQGEAGRPRRPGVYSVCCRSTGRGYVGTSLDLCEDLDEHRAALAGGRHACPSMQADWDRHGEDAFDFVVLDEVPPGDVDADDERLQHLRDLWVDQLGLDEGSAY